MSPTAVSGQNLYLEIARTRSDGKLDFAQPKQSSNSEKWSKDRSTSMLTLTFFSPSKERQKWRENRENLAPNVENRCYVCSGGSGYFSFSSLSTGLLQRCPALIPKARFRHRTSHEPNRIQWIKFMWSTASESIRNGWYNSDRLSRSSRLALVQSLNSPFCPPPIGAEPGRAKEESRITCMRMLRANQSKITRSQPRCSRQCVAQCLSQLALWKKTFSLALILS